MLLLCSCLCFVFGFCLVPLLPAQRRQWHGQPEGMRQLPHELRFRGAALPVFFCFVFGLPLYFASVLFPPYLQSGASGTGSQRGCASSHTSSASEAQISDSI